MKHVNLLKAGLRYSLNILYYAAGNVLEQGACCWRSRESGAVHGGKVERGALC